MSKSAGEEELAFQLKCAKIPFVREHAFAKDQGRRWRFDFALGLEKLPTSHMVSSFRLPTQCAVWENLLAVEIEGGAFSGGHRRGLEANKDCEKANAAALMGWRVLRFTPYMVETGEAIETIATALGVET